MPNTVVDEILGSYVRLYVKRVGKLPRKADLDRVLARTLLSICGDDVELSKFVLRMWFESPDPWYAAQGFRLLAVFHAVNRLIGMGDLAPWGRDDLRDVSRRLCAGLSRPRLEIVSATRP